jgi:hypothetical protein
MSPCRIPSCGLTSLMIDSGVHLAADAIWRHGQLHSLLNQSMGQLWAGLFTFHRKHLPGPYQVRRIPARAPNSVDVIPVCLHGTSLNFRMSTAMTMLTKTTPKTVAHCNTIFAIQTSQTGNRNDRTQIEPNSANTKETRAPAKVVSSFPPFPALVAIFMIRSTQREDTLDILFRNLDSILLLQRLVVVRQFLIFAVQSLSLRLDGLDLLVLLGNRLGESSVLSTVGGGGSGTELLDGGLQSQNVKDEGVGAVEDQGKKEGEATEVPNRDQLSKVGSVLLLRGRGVIHVTLRVELASLNLHTVDTNLSVRARRGVLRKLTLDTVDAVHGVDEENQNENERNLRTRCQPGCFRVPRSIVDTFMPYCSLAINGLCWMNSNAFLRQVKGRGNTRSRKIDISSTRSANTYHIK